MIYFPLCSTFVVLSLRVFSHAHIELTQVTSHLVMTKSWKHFPRLQGIQEKYINPLMTSVIPGML
jgi:hypothetical protein